MSRFLCLFPLVLVAATWSPAVAQEEWSLETLREQSLDFQEEGIVPRLRQIGTLVQNMDRARAAIVASIHGDHREYQLKIERYLDQLADDRWLSREDAERTLVEIGGRAMAQIEERAKNGETLEERIRCARIVDAIVSRGREDEEREIRLLRGLVATALYMETGERLKKALISALGHTDPIVVEGAVRALGAVGGAEDVGVLEARARRSAPNSGLRRAALGAIGRLAVPEALDAAERLLTEPDLLRTWEAAALLRQLWLRADAGPLLERLRSHPDPIVSGLAALPATPGPSTDLEPFGARLQLADRDELPASVAAVEGDTIRVTGAVDGLDPAHVLLADCDGMELDRAPMPVEGARVFLTQGTLLAGDLIAVDEEAVVVLSHTFGEVRVAREEVQGLALDPKLDRLVGASTKIDRIRLRDNSMVDGNVLKISGEALTLQDETGDRRAVPVETVAGVLFRRPAATVNDDAVYTRVELVDGERLLAHVGLARADVLGLAIPGIGAALVPTGRLARLEFGVGGGAMWGFTLVADYSENRIIELDDSGKETFALEDVYGAWDAECLDSGNLLVTEFALNRVVEVTREGEVVWSYDDLKNPYDADRLANGNTLIADTFGERVIEVDQGGQIVWSFTGIKPYDVERLANGNTLIADGSNADRVLEVDPSGEVVWELTGMQSVHDVDRLPNGNTLITQRQLHRVIEVDREGNVVFTIENLNSPSDADRLPNGHTIVAENGGIREFDRRGVMVFEKAMAWAVEVNKY